MAERALSKIQYGKETISTHGTAVAATKMLAMGAIPIKPDRKPVYPPVNIGIRSRDVYDVFYNYLVQNTLSIPYGYFQILPMLFSCGLKGNVTASEVTPSQADYLWTHTPSLTGDNTPDSITLEQGDDIQAFEAEYVMFERIRISGKVAQDQGESPVAIEADFFGRQNTATTFTGALSIPICEFMNAKLARFYLDTAWSGIGGTEKTNILRGFDIEILTGLHPKQTGSGNRYFNVHGQSFIDVMAAFTLEGDANADAIWDAFMARTFQAVRLAINGAQIGTGTNHNLTLDISGTWEEVIPLASEDRGNNIHTAMLHARYDGTGAKKLQATVTTNSNTL